MRRLNRSANTPLGAAFFLFVSLAIIPVSLKAAGLKLGLAPRLSAAIDIWTEVAETFGPNYGAASGSELASLFITDSTPQDAASVESCPLEQRACAGEEEEIAATDEVLSTLAVTPVANAQDARAPRTACKLAAKYRGAAKPVESPAGPAEISVKIDTSVRTVRALHDLKVEALMRREVMNRLDRFLNQPGTDQPSINGLPLPKSFRMLFRFKQSATSSITGAECKARVALDRSLRLERASLNTMTSAPDNCDL